MLEKCPSCIKIVDGSESIVRFGKSSNGKQRYRCKNCNKTFLTDYSNRACKSETSLRISVLLKEGCGIRSISRILEISPTTVQKRIIEIASQIAKPNVLMNKSYEVDQICTYIGNKSKRRWIVYALCEEDNKVVDYRIGTRSNRTFRPLIDTLVLGEARRIYTDGLSIYRHLIDPRRHVVKQYGTNHIERMNLTLRTHLRRLHRRSICFSRSIRMLKACLRIYFWAPI